MTRSGDTLLVFGLGYSGRAVAQAAQAAGFSVTATSRSPGEHQFPAGATGVDFAAAGPAIEKATHLLATAPPDEAGDPVLAPLRGDHRRGAAAALDRLSVHDRRLWRSRRRLGR